MARPYKLTEQQRIDICDKYQEGFSTTELSKTYNIAINSVRKLLLKNKIQIRTLKESKELDRFKDKISGKNNGAWKGGITIIKNKIRGLPEYNEWRIKVYNRDNYTCQECGDRGQKGNKVILNCDHINPLSQIVEYNNITSVDEALSCKELWDIDNGRTLCYDCHLKTDTYGFNLGHFTKSVEQLDDNNNVIETFSSIKECSDILNIHRTSINRVCSGVYKTAGGFKFRYAKNK